MQSASSSKDTRLRLGVVMDALPKEKQTNTVRQLNQADTDYHQI